MIKPDFEKCSALATKLLYRQNIRDRILDIQKLDYGDKIVLFDSIQKYAQIVKKPLSDFYQKDKPILKDGCLLIIDSNTYVVLYNAEINHWEHLNWTLAHEIGHIYLEHKDDGKLEEIEAHFFAAQLLMPEYSIFRMSKEYGVISDIDIMEIFGVSRHAATKRLRTMSKKTSFRAGAMDREIWEIQKRRVELYFECDKNSYEYRNYLDYMICLEDEYNQLMMSQMYSGAY